MSGQDTSKDTPKETAPADKSKANQPDEQQLKIVSAVGYLGILFLIPYLMFPKEKFTVFHANQGLILLILAVGLNVIAIPLLGTVTFGLGFLLAPIVWLALLAFVIIGVINATNGHMKRLPLIGSFDLLKVQE